MTVEMRTRVWVSLFVLVVFLAGLGAGIGAATWLGPRPGFGPGRGAPPRALNERPRAQAHGVPARPE